MFLYCSPHQWGAVALEMGKIPSPACRKNSPFPPHLQTQPLKFTESQPQWRKKNSSCTSPKHHSQTTPVISTSRQWAVPKAHASKSRYSDRITRCFKRFRCRAKALRPKQLPIYCVLAAVSEDRGESSFTIV